MRRPPKFRSLIGDATKDWWVGGRAGAIGVGGVVAITVVLRANLLVGLVLLYSAAGWGFMVVRRWFDDLADVASATTAVADGAVNLQVPGTRRDDELGRIAAAVERLRGELLNQIGRQERAEAGAHHADARIQRFVADAGRELRTPVTALQASTDYFRQIVNDDPVSAAKIVGRLETETDRLGKVVDDMLLLARLDEDYTLDTALVDFGLVVRQTVEAAGAVDPDRKLDLSATLEPIIIGDEARLRHVVSNLVDNALHHTPPGSPVEVFLGRAEFSDGEWAMLEVRDHGPGLAIDQARAVFDPFHRMDQTSLANGQRHDHEVTGQWRTIHSRAGVRPGGSGLGLAIVDAIVSAHNGRVEVDSAPGEGAMFRVLLPLPQSGTRSGSEQRGVVEAQ